MKRQIIIVAGCLAVGVVAATLLILQHRSSHQQADSSSNKPLYAALGDSVAAGVGLEPDSDSSACNRTDQAYSHIVAADRYRLTSLACSGATVSAGILGSQTVNQLALPSQLNQLFKLSNPAVVTLTIGANDVGWTEFITKCYTDKCGTPSDQALVSDRLNNLTTNLDETLRRIADRYPVPPALYVTGYYQVFPSSIPANCADLTGIDSSELDFGRSVQSQINTTIQQAVAGFSFAHFVPVDFSGHELCTSDPWVQGLSSNQPYHPTAAGQKVIADAILKQITKDDAR